ncbi:hypothetical protein [Halorussus salinisoli]|uniref:hypothetical protein n=1 Tax=Halorussus salinisoli TaxID=2558242 RepID=UPI0010C1DE8C|nr:hypothetical protein [Halorussus salinisoli]
MGLDLKDEIGGANLFVQPLEEVTLETKSDYYPTRLIIEDNVGESIHLHYRNFRLEFTVDDFLELSENLRSAMEELENGDS